MGLTDWQCLARGQWALDVAYALAIGLTTSDRRAWEAVRPVRLDVAKENIRRAAAAVEDLAAFDAL